MRLSVKKRHSIQDEKYQARTEEIISADYLFVQPRKRSVFGVFQFSKREKRIPAKKVTGPQKKKNFYVRSIIFGTIIGQCTTWGNEGMRKQE